ncbi:acetyltransferase [Paradesulfitobacterium ferrireducens]|uniref:acetyltransferase n=1 Tax=Paradesulfitobacterium ferrireducens TaxID=2816476 RepID=UPI001A8C0E9C|nr:acetyltransferase [Paradesulfitobacterium ferrireducens]
MKSPVIVLGAGGHAKVLIDTLLLGSAELVGVTDSNPRKLKDNVLGIPVLGTDEVVLEYSADKILLVNGLGTTSTMENRKNLFDVFKNRGYTFATVIHPSAVISDHAQIREGAQIMAGAIVQVGCSIGANTIVNTKVSIDHDCNIGANVHLAPGVTLSGGVHVAEGVHIGTGATVIQGVTIGKNALIGAGTLVLKDIAEGTTVVGVPARVIHARY